MPTVAFVVRGVSFAVKWDFGRCPRWPREWTVSVQSRSPYNGPTFGLLDDSTDLRGSLLDGFGPDFAFGPYPQDHQRFTCDVQDELDVATLVRLLSDEI